MGRPGGVERGLLPDPEGHHGGRHVSVGGAAPCGRARRGVSDRDCVSVVSWPSKDTAAGRIYKNPYVSSCGSQTGTGYASWLVSLVSETMSQGTFLYLPAPRLRWGSSPQCTHCRLATGSRWAEMRPAASVSERVSLLLSRVASSVGFT